MIRTSSIFLTLMILVSSDSQAESFVELDSGATLRVFGIGKVHAQDKASWRLRYETTHDVDANPDVVAAETISLWKEYARPLVEKNGWNYFIICATTPQVGGSMNWFCHQFKYERKWLVLPPHEAWQEIP